MRTHLGKTILFTDNDDWTNEEIVLGYRAQYHIESAFRDMKNPHFLGWSPMFHWTDSKIRVHAFSPPGTTYNRRAGIFFLRPL